MKQHKENIFLGIVLVIMVILMSIMSPEEFLSEYTFLTLVHQIPEFGIIALSVMVLMLLGHINLSVIAMTKLSGIIGGLAMIRLGLPGYVSAILGVVIMILVGLLCGVLNGAIVSFVGVPSIITTLAMMLLFEGFALHITHGGAVSNFPEVFLWIGNDNIAFVPIPLFVFILFILITRFLLKKSDFGSYIYRVGEDEEAAKYSGINISKVIFFVYCYAGILTGVAAIIMTSRYNSIRADYGTSYLLKSIVAVALGGVNVNGGKGSVIGVVISVCILSVLSRGLDLVGLNASLIDLSMGLILLVVLFINHYLVKDKKVVGE